ncbi:MAG: hypothetical protein QOJ81_1322 [Chloroflexota bacterium]|nr:hypothetical protein [Chloroflexota bacterium]
MDPADVAKNKMAIANNALPVLLDRAGGSITVTLREFEELAARYGGATNLTLVMEKIDSPEPGFRVTLVSKKPGQGDLPV